MTEAEHKESRKKAREFIVAFERGIGRGNLDELFKIYNEAVEKAEECKCYPHYLIALVRTTYRMRGILPGYYENYKRIRALLVSIHGEEQTKSFLIGLEPMT